MPKVQKGLEQTAKPGITLATYQESKVRWIHTVARTMGGGLMLGQRHPFTGALYERASDGNVIVHHDDKSGRISRRRKLDRGRDLRSRPADVQLDRRAEGPPSPPAGRLTLSVIRDR